MSAGLVGTGVAELQRGGYTVPPNKVQRVHPIEILDTELTLTRAWPLKPKIHIRVSLTLTQLQSILGEIHSILPWVPISKNSLVPLFSL